MHPLPSKALKRLQKRERYHRQRAVKMGRPAFLVDVEKLWSEQEGRCCCDRVDYPGCGRQALDPNLPGNHPEGIVIGHLQHLAGAGEGTHSQANVGLMRSCCNARMAGRENHDAGVYRKLRVTDGIKSADAFREAPKSKRQIPSRGFTNWKPKGAVSKLSKEYRDQVKERME